MNFSRVKLKSHGILYAFLSFIKFVLIFSSFIITFFTRAIFVIFI